MTTNSVYVVRLGTVEDVPVIAHQRACMFRDMGSIDDAAAALLESASQSHLKKSITSGEYLPWLVEFGNTVVAGGGIITRQLLPRPNHMNGDVEAYVLNMYTEPSHRRRGLARLIITAMLDWCSKQSIERITLHASVEGRQLYENLGFVQSTEMRFEAKT